MHVRLEQEWTDGEGTTHPAGSTVEVDAATLAELEQEGIVAEPASGSWAGPTGGNADPNSGSWAGPTGNPSGGSGG